MRKQAHSRIMAYIGLALCAVIIVSGCLMLFSASVERLAASLSLFTVLAGLVVPAIGLAGFYMRQSTTENIAGVHGGEHLQGVNK